MSTSRTGAARSAAILLISCHISALKATRKFPPSEHVVETEFHSQHYEPPPQPVPQSASDDDSQSSPPPYKPPPPPPSMPSTADEATGYERPTAATAATAHRPTVNTAESGSVASGSMSQGPQQQPLPSHHQQANRLYQDMVMTRYIERQLNHQRQLLSLELPEMLQNRSQSLNERLRKILGLVDNESEDWRADQATTTDDDEEEDEEGPHHQLSMGSAEGGPEGSAGDLFNDDPRPYSKLANAHIEVVDALPSPACDTAKFAVI